MSQNLLALLFDFDLTLADSNIAIVDCIKTALRAMNRTIPDANTMRKSIGLSLPDTYTFLTQDNDIEAKQLFAKLFVAHADEVMVEKTSIYPAVFPLLQHLRKHNVAIGIVSTKFRYRIEAIVQTKGLSGLIDVVIGGEDVTNHKPDPEGILAALSALNVSSAQAMYIGDHPMDATAARAAGVQFRGVLTGQTDAAMWIALGERCVEENITDLASMFSTPAH